MTGEKPDIDHDNLVSVLMPCYNHEAYVISALESVASSDYKSIEFIFIDDASKDNSFNLARKWFEENKGRFVKTVCIQHEENRGICRTFNELYAHSRGEYVSYLASDDLLLTDAISRQVNIAQSKGVDFIFSDCHLIDESGKLISDSALQYFSKNRHKLTKNKTCLIADVVFAWTPPWNKFFMRSALFKKIGPFDESLSYEDRDFIIRVLINDSFEFMPVATTAYRIRLKNRLTPGLVLEDVMRDLRKADSKNYLNSSGILRWMLGILTYSYEERYRELEIKNTWFIWFATRMAGMFKRTVLKLHRVLVRCS